MQLPLTFRYQDWEIKYNLLGGNEKSPTRAAQTCVVFVHGTPWSSAVYRPTIEALLARKSYRVLVYDLPGYGQSQQYTAGENVTGGDFPGDTSVKFQALALAELLKHVQWDGKDSHPAPAVIAHDIAGTIVLRAHLIHGCDFDTMMLCDANTVLPWGDGFYKLARSEPHTFIKLPPSIFEAVVRAVTQSAVHDPNVLRAGWEDVLAEPWIGSPSDPARAQEAQRSFVRQIAQANDKDVAEMLEGNMYEHVRCNVKVVWGEQDQWIPKEKVEDLIQRLGGKAKETAFIPDAGHLVMLDQPARFAVEVYDWLMRYSADRSRITS